MSTEDPIGAVLDAAAVDKRYQPTKTRIPICLDSDLVLEIERLDEQLLDVQRDDEALNRVPQAVELAERIIALREQAKAEAVVFEFRGIGRGAYRRLIEAHKPTDEQLHESGEGRKPRWNVETFGPALLARACTVPTGTDESWWRRKWDEWEEGRIALVWAACLSAQEGYMEIPKADLAYELTGTSASKRR